MTSKSSPILKKKKKQSIIPHGIYSVIAFNARNYYLLRHIVKKLNCPLFLFFFFLSIVLNRKYFSFRYSNEKDKYNTRLICNLIYCIICTDSLGVQLG